ncbi:LCP family protein [Dellaglioa sp. P0083]|uniref:LCP family glycopolymer transferase n=1 Tax=Dellaglioa kimchii TaxID=3344667 RepID=UPI0038D46DFE
MAKNNNLGMPSPIKGSSQSNTNKHPILWTLLIIMILGIASGGVYAYSVFTHTEDTVAKTYKKTKAKKLRNVSSILSEKKPFSILLMGTDTGALGRSDTGRTDTMIVATVNPTTNKTTLTSIPRDTQVKIDGSNESSSKINSAYTYGGKDGSTSAVNTVQNLLDIPIDYYMLINMNGLKKIVDTVGGVDVKPLLSFKLEGTHYKKGETIHLNGKQALAYTRMRHSDPLGDYGRQKRQKQIITAITGKAKSVNSLANYKKLLKTIDGNMVTDLSFNDMLTIETNYSAATESIHSDFLQGVSTDVDGLSYEVPTSTEKKRVSNAIRSQLGLNKSTQAFTSLEQQLSK